MLETEIPLSKRYEITTKDVAYIENSLLARFKSRDFKLKFVQDGKAKYLLGYHAYSGSHRLVIPIDGVKKGLEGMPMKYLLGNSFKATLSLHFSRDALQREVEGAIALYSKLKLE